MNPQICTICGTSFEPKSARRPSATCSSKCGGEQRARNWDARASEKLGEDIRAAMQRLYLRERLSTTQIAERFGWPKGAGRVYLLLKRYGIPIRGKSESVALDWGTATEQRRKATGDNMRRVTTEHYEKGVTTRAAQYREKPTYAEQLTINYLESIGEPFEFQVQFGIYIADFVLPLRSLVLEIDTLHHHSPEIAERDERRTQFLNEQGYQVVRAWHVKGGDAAFLRRVSTVLEAQPIRLPE